MSRADKPTQNQKVLAMLMEAQPGCISNLDLNEVGFCYRDRIFDLRRKGFDIETIRTKNWRTYWRLLTPKRLIDIDTLTVKKEKVEQGVLF